MVVTWLKLAAEKRMIVVEAVALPRSASSQAAKSDEEAAARSRSQGSSGRESGSLKSLH